MIPLLLAAAVLLQSEVPVERQLVVSITAKQLEGGILSEITWDGDALLLQGVMANPDGTLSGRYIVVPAKSTRLVQAKEQSDTSLAYWTRKANRRSPTGAGEIHVSMDAKLPMYGVGSLEQRINGAIDHGGTRQTWTVQLGRLILHERENAPEPYDGEIWSWSPPELNRIAYVDGQGALWVAYANGTDPQRLLKGNFTLPAWSEDGRVIAVAEKKDGGKRWDVIAVNLPQRLRTVK